jgi:hypothetical protein
MHWRNQQTPLGSARQRHDDATVAGAGCLADVDVVCCRGAGLSQERQARLTGRRNDKHPPPPQSNCLTIQSISSAMFRHDWSRVSAAVAVLPPTVPPLGYPRVMTWRGFPQQDFPAIFLAMVFLLRRFTCAKEVVWMPEVC